MSVIYSLVRCQQDSDAYTYRITFSKQAGELIKGITLLVSCHFRCLPCTIFIKRCTFWHKSAETIHLLPHVEWPWTFGFRLKWFGGNNERTQVILWGSEDSKRRLFFTSLTPPSAHFAENWPAVPLRFGYLPSLLKLICKSKGQKESTRVLYLVLSLDKLFEINYIFFYITLQLKIFRFQMHSGDIFLR